MQWFDRASIPKRPAGLLNNGRGGFYWACHQRPMIECVWKWEWCVGFVECSCVGNWGRKMTIFKVQVLTQPALSKCDLLTFSNGTTLNINTLRPRQNGSHFPDDIFECIFLNEDTWISNEISLKYVPWGLIDNMSALVQVMAWRRTGHKPLPEPMTTQFIDTYMRH